MEVFCATKLSKLSFVGEWFLYEEWAYGHSRVHNKDLAKDRGIWENTAKKIVLSKLQYSMRARSRLPFYALHEEDLKSMKPHWNDEFTVEQRIVMHDNTNLHLMAPSNSDLNHSLYLDYYSAACAKAGTVLQRCG